MAPLISDDERRRRLIITAAVVAALALVGIGIALALAAGHTGPRTTPPVQRIDEPTTTPVIEPETTASVVPTTPPAESATESETTETTEQPEPSSPLPLLAFRLNRAVYVANADGTDPRPVVSAPDGPFALSPDGSLLAVITGGRLQVFDAVTSAPVAVGTADRVTPVWLPNSAGVLFVRAGLDGKPQVWSMLRNGTQATELADGDDVAVSPDSLVIAVLPGADAADGATVSLSKDRGQFATLPVSDGAATAVALTRDRLFVATLSSSGYSTIWSMRFDGTGARQIVAPFADPSRTTTIGRLLVSPDEKKLLYTLESDDGYSRLRMIPTSGGAIVSLSSRRDDYPVQWSADSSRILYVEGNQIQGESTALMQMNSDGSQRQVLVSGAAL